MQTLPSTPALLHPEVHHTASGLTIIAEQMPVEAVNFSLWIAAGSILEQDSMNGMAHFLEHMVFKGTDRLCTGEFERIVEQCGGTTNAMTSQDYTCFYVTTAPSDFTAIAPLQCDLLLHPIFPGDEFEQERRVVLEEIRRAADQSRRRIFAQMMETTFQQLPYRRSVLGPARVIESLEVAQMREFHQTWYHPQRMTAVVVGNLPTEKMVDCIEAQFSSLGTSAVPRSPQFSPEPLFTDIETIDTTDPQLTETRLMFLWRVPGIKSLETVHALDIIARILGAGRTSRLVHKLREERRLVTHISASNLTQIVQGTFSISASLPIEHLAEVETAIVTEVNRLQQEWVSEQELAQVHRQTVNRFVFENETPSSRASLYGYAQRIAGDLQASLDYPQSIRQISRAALQTAAQQFLSLSGYRILRVHPVS
jgi:zinc protease